MAHASLNPLLHLPESYRHWERERVRWSDTDQLGHVNHLSFGAYCETGRSLFLRPTQERRMEEGTLLLLAQLTLHFVGEAHWPADIRIGTGVLSIGHSSCSIGQGLFEGERCFGSAETVLVLIDEKSRRPRPIPDWLRQWLEGFRIV